MLDSKEREFAPIAETGTQPDLSHVEPDKPESEPDADASEAPTTSDAADVSETPAPTPPTLPAPTEQVDRAANKRLKRGAWYNPLDGISSLFD